MATDTAEIPAAAAAATATDLDAAIRDRQARLVALDPDGAKAAADAAVARVQAEAAALEAEVQTMQMVRMARGYLRPQITTVTFARDTVRDIRKTCCDELIALPRVIRDSRTEGISQNLKASILAIDGLGSTTVNGFSLNTLRVGQLLKAAGFPESAPIENQVVGEIQWPGSLPEIERRLRDLQSQLVEAENRLAAALLDETGRAKQQAAIAAKNAAPQRKTRGDGSVYLKYGDGRVEEIE